MIWVVNFLFIVATRGFYTRLTAGLGLGWRETSWNDVLLEPPRRRGVWRKAVRLIFPALDLQPTRVLLGLTSIVSCVTCYLVLWFCRPHASNPLSHTSSYQSHASCCFYTPLGPFVTASPVLCNFLSGLPRQNIHQ